jgi:hypothetical protein
MCSTECLCLDDHCESEHADQANKGHPGDSDKSDHHDSSFCDSLHSTCLTSTTVEVAKPDFLICWQDFLSAAPGSDIPLAGAPILRQPPDRKWVFTPDVCLGPAFRCHGPPVSALS